MGFGSCDFLAFEAFGFALAFPLAGLVVSWVILGDLGFSALVGFFAFGVPAVCLVLVMLSVPVVFVVVIRVPFRVTYDKSN